MGGPKRLKLLLDTHIWLWSALEAERLSQEICEELENSQNELWISPISIWESLVLAEKGRITLQPDPETWVLQLCARLRLRRPLSNTGFAFLSRRYSLPHQDPSDPFIAATASVFGLTLVTEDRKLHKIEGVQILSSTHGPAR